MKKINEYYVKGLVLTLLGGHVLFTMMHKTIRFFISFDLNKFITRFHFGKTLVADLFSYIVYLLFDVLFHDIESLLNYFLR